MYHCRIPWCGNTLWPHIIVLFDVSRILDRCICYRCPLPRHQHNKGWAFPYEDQSLENPSHGPSGADVCLCVFVCMCVCVCIYIYLNASLHALSLSLSLSHSPSSSLSLAHFSPSLSYTVHEPAFVSRHKCGTWNKKHLMTSTTWWKDVIDWRRKHTCAQKQKPVTSTCLLFHLRDPRAAKEADRTPQRFCWIQNLRGCSRWSTHFTFGRCSSHDTSTSQIRDRLVSPTEHSFVWECLAVIVKKSCLLGQRSARRRRFFGITHTAVWTPSRPNVQGTFS
jgi:hypothetical protein